MTSAERVGIWFVAAALVGMAFIWWAALNKRIDEVTPPLTARAVPSTTTSTASPLAAEVAGLRRAVTELCSACGAHVYGLDNRAPTIRRPPPQLRVVPPAPMGHADPLLHSTDTRGARPFDQDDDRRWAE